jgi:PKD domain
MAVVRYRAVQPAEDDTAPTHARYAILGVGIFVIAAVALVVGLAGGQENRAQPQPLIPDLFPHTPMTRTQSISSTLSEVSGTEVSSPVPTTTTTQAPSPSSAPRTTMTTGRPPPTPTPPPPPPPSFTRSSGARAPQARISHSCNGLTCTFDAANSFAREGTIVAYEWAFGDGSNGTSVRVTHTYPAAGEYTVWLLVRDDAGRTDVATAHLTLVS